MRTLPLDPDELLDDVVSELRLIEGEVVERFGGLSAAQLTWRSSPERWSISHCLAHLARTGAAYRGKLEPAVDAARRKDLRAGGPARGTWFGRWFTGRMGPDKGFRVRAPRVFRPSADVVGGDALVAFRDEQARLEALAQSARGLDLDRIRFATPVTPLIRLCATDAFRVLTEHEARHLAQARRVRNAPDFPA